MMQAKRKKILQLLAITLYTSSIFFSIFLGPLTQTASALYHELEVIDRTRIRMKVARASTNNSDWQNIINADSDIETTYEDVAGLNQALSEWFTDKDFSDKNIWDNNENYTYKIPDTDCTSDIQIDSPSSGSTQRVSLKIPVSSSSTTRPSPSNPNPPGGRTRCATIETASVTLGSPENLRVAFQWIDAGTIRAYQAGNSASPGPGAEFFIKAESNDGTDRFYPEGSDEDCRDMLTRLPSEDLHSALFYDTTTAGTRPMVCRDTSHTAVSNPWGTGNPLSVRIAGVENASKPEGSERPGGQGDPAALQAPDSCESKNNILLSWLLCGVLDLVDNTVTGITNAADSLLEIDKKYYEGAQMKAVWSYFRAIATFLLLAVGLVIVISQAMGDFFSAYTVKKMLPRLVIAAILIQLSWELFTLAIEITNQIAWGIEGLIYGPFGGKANLSFDNLVSMAGGGNNGLFVAFILGATINAFIGGAVLSLALVALLGLLIGFGLLLFRQVLIVALLLVSPIALLAWILPNTEKGWKIWWESFSKLLLMYPLILAMIAAGRVFAWVAADVDPGEQSSNLFAGFGFNDIGALAIITLGYFGPLFLISKTFQMAGAAFSSVYGLTQKSSRGFFDAQRQKRAEKRKDRVARAGANSLWNQNQGGIRGAIAKRANTAASWAVAPGANASYALKGTNLPFSRGGRIIASQIEHQKLEQSKKLFEELNQAGFNDKAYRSLAGAWTGLSEETKDRLIADTSGRYVDSKGNLKASALNSEEAIRHFAGILGQSSVDTERIGAQALTNSAARISSLYADGDMNKADTRATGIMGLAAHGFAGSDDIATVGNLLAGEGGHEFGYAQAVVTQAEVMGARSRPDVKAGYGHTVATDANGHRSFVDGMSEEGGRARALLKTVSSGDIQGSKGGFLKALGGEIEQVIRDDKQNKAAAERIKTLRDGGLTDDEIRKSVPDGAGILDRAAAHAETGPMRDALIAELRSTAGPYSQAAVDTRAQAEQILKNLQIPVEDPRYAIGGAGAADAMREGIVRPPDPGATGAPPGPEI